MWGGDRVCGVVTEGVGGDRGYGVVTEDVGW